MLLTEFGLDNSFLESDELTSKSTNRKLLDLWKDYGVLVFGNHQNPDFILEKLKEKISPKVYLEWRDAFSDYKIINLTKTWDTFCNYNDYKEIVELKDIFKTGITEPITLELIGQLPNYISYCSHSKFEVVEIDDLDNSVNFKLAKKISTKDIEYQDDNEKIWEEKFQSLSRFTKNIVIIDHYFLRNIIEDKRKGRQTNVEYILEKLKLNGKRYNITIISLGSNNSSNNYNDIISEFQSINSSHLKQTYNKIHIISCNSNYFKVLAHDRFIQFDDYVCTLGKGLDVFRSIDTPQCTFSMVKEENSDIRKRINLVHNYKHWEHEFLP